MTPEVQDQELFGENFAGLSLHDVMQMLNWSKATSIISIESDSSKGHIHFLEGEVVHAETATEKGPIAFHTLFQQDLDSFKINATTKKPKKVTIFSTFNKLMLDSVKFIEENLPDDDESIEEVEVSEPVAVESPQKPDTPAENIFKPSSNSGVVRQDLHRLCKTITRRKSDILACSVMDLESGESLGVYHKAEDDTPHFYVNTIVQSVIHLYRNDHKNPMSIALSTDEKQDSGAGLDELYFRVGKVGHFMEAIPELNVLVVLAMKSKVSMGMGWVNLRRILQMVEEKISAKKSA